MDEGLRHAGKEAAVHFAEFREYLPVQPGRIPGLGLGEVSDLLERLLQDKADGRQDAPVIGTLEAEAAEGFLDGGEDSGGGVGQRTVEIEDYTVESLHFMNLRRQKYTLPSNPASLSAARNLTYFPPKANNILNNSLNWHRVNDLVKQYR